MSHRYNIAGSIEDFAASMTDRALRVARQASVDGDSVALELQLWKSLAGQLEREAGLHQWLRYGESVVHHGTLHQIMHRAILDVAQEQSPVRNPRELESLIRPLVSELSFSNDEHRDLERLFPSREPTTRWLGRSGILRRLQVVALN